MFDSIGSFPVSFLVWLTFDLSEIKVVLIAVDKSHDKMKRKRHRKREMKITKSEDFVN